MAGPPPLQTSPMAPVLVIGGAGYLGGHLLPLLISQGHQPVVLDDLSRPFKGRCLDLDNLKFEEMFLWLSASLSRVSQSAPGDRVQLVDPRVGDDVYDGWVL